MSATDDATKTVKDVVTTNHDKGAHDAGTKLHDDFVNYSKTHSAEDTKTYWDTVSKQLKDNGMLNTLAFNWADKNTEVSNSGGVVTREKTADELRHNQDMVAVSGDKPGNAAENRFKAMMEQEIVDSFDKSGKHEKGYEWMHGTSGYAGWSTIESHLKDVESARQTQVGKEQLRSPELMTAMQSPDGKGPSDFWKTLVNKDGNITQSALDNYIQKAHDQQTLPDKFDPNNPDKTKYNAEWLKAAEQLKSHTGQFQNGDFGGLLSGFAKTGDIDQNSLAQGLGYKDANDMLANNKKQGDATPVGDQGDQGGQPKPGDLNSRANDITSAIAFLPGDATKDIFNNGLTKDKLNALLDQDKKDQSLTQNQRDTLTKLQKDWDQTVPGGAQGTVKFDSWLKPGQDGQEPAALQNLKKQQQEATAELTALNGADMSRVVDDKGNIDKAKLDGYMAKKPDDMKQEDYDKTKDQMKYLQDHFNDISHDGKTISHDNMKQYAAAHSFDAWKDYKDKPDAAAPQDQGPDKATKDAQAAFDKLTQTTSLQKGELPFQMAQRILAERAKVTGEPTDMKAVMREVAQICVDNNIGKPEVIASLQKKLENKDYKFSEKDLPKELNHVRYGQELKVYNDVEKAKVIDAIKKKNGTATASADPGQGDYDQYGPTDNG